MQIVANKMVVATILNSMLVQLPKNADIDIIPLNDHMNWIFIVICFLLGRQVK